MHTNVCIFQGMVSEALLQNSPLFQKSKGIFDFAPYLGDGFLICLQMEISTTDFGRNNICTYIASLHLFSVCHSHAVA